MLIVLGMFTKIEHRRFIKFFGAQCYKRKLMYATINQVKN